MRRKWRKAISVQPVKERTTIPQVPVTLDMLNGDLHVIGLEDNGDVIQVNYDSGDTEPYTTGENLVQWGLHNLRDEEVRRLLSLQGIRPIDRGLLEKWHPGLTQDEGYDLAGF